MANKNNPAEPEVFDFAGPEIEEPTVEHDLPAAKDPTMDPGDPRWNPQKYFAAQPSEIIVVKRNDSDALADPSGEKKIVVPVSINGYQLNIEKGRPVRVPRDFASHLVDIGAAYRYSDIPDAMGR